MAVHFRKLQSEKFLVPEGTHQAVCNGVWDIGLQKTEFKGEVKYKYQIVVRWELDERINDPESEHHDKRFVKYKTYNNVFANRSALKLDLESWRGKPFNPAEIDNFNIEKLVDTNCLLQIQHRETDSGIWANIVGIMSLPKNTPKIEAEVSAGMPEWIVEKRTQGQVNEGEQGKGMPLPEEPPTPTNEPRCTECGNPLETPDQIDQRLCSQHCLPF